MSLFSLTEYQASEHSRFYPRYVKHYWKVIFQASNMASEIEKWPLINRSLCFIIRSVISDPLSCVGAARLHVDTRGHLKHSSRRIYIQQLCERAPTLFR